MESENSIFVKLDKYKEVNDLVNVIKGRIQAGKTILNKIQELKSKEDQELADWTDEILDVEKKIKFVENTLFEPEV